MSRQFISVEEARVLIQEYCPLLNTIVVSLDKALGLSLATDIYSSIDLPPFNQSSMDGYAFNYADYAGDSIIRVSSESAAGNKNSPKLERGTAARIFTGAPVPKGADTVIMQEKVIRIKNEISFNPNTISQGANVRIAGSEIKKGELILPAKSILSPSALGLLAACGISEISVFRAPRIAIIITGDELQFPGQELKPGQVYESNATTLSATLKQHMFSEIELFYAKDDLLRVSTTIQKSLVNNDVVLLTGGVSVGDYDFVVEACEENFIQQIFHKIRQKPGKPIYFGRKQEKLIFGLPGNPASVMTCFYIYVLPALGQLCGRNLTLKRFQAQLKNELSKPSGLTQFLRGFLDGNAATNLPAQESHRISSFVHANCLIELEEEADHYKKGDTVWVHALPTCYG